MADAMPRQMRRQQAVLIMVVEEAVEERRAALAARVAGHVLGGIEHVPLAAMDEDVQVVACQHNVR